MSLAKRHLVQQAHEYNDVKHRVNGYFVSEKLDGMRAWWDGGVSCGRPVTEVPWANTLKDTDTRYEATGLWSRYGKVIMAPDWWLDRLPEQQPLDGELWIGPGTFQRLRSIVSRTVNKLDEEWNDVIFKVYDIPSSLIFSFGYINLPQCVISIPRTAIEYVPYVWKYGEFEEVQKFLQDNLEQSETVQLVEQLKLPQSTPKMTEMLDQRFRDVLSTGGEGLMLRKPTSIWTPHRTYDLLKVKPWSDAEGRIIGFYGGEGKLHGLIGSVHVAWNSVTFKLSGLTDSERELKGFLAPKKYSQEDIAVNFKVGDVITFKYRELTRDNKPKDARYMRHGTGNC